MMIDKVALTLYADIPAYSTHRYVSLAPGVMCTLSFLRAVHTRNYDGKYVPVPILPLPGTGTN